MNNGMSIAKILLPVEFSDRCLGAARYAEFIACHFHAELTLLHVVSPPYMAYGEVNAYPPAADLYSQRWEESQRRLDAFPRDVPARLKICRLLLDGDPARRIVEYAHRGHFDLIVMPTHGYGPFRRFLLGSVTAKVLHDAECPVWTGPHLEQAPDLESFSLRKVACAVDFGPQSRAALGWAGAMAREFAADLVILHVLPGSTVSAGGFTFDPEWCMQMEQQALAQIVRLQADAGTAGELRVEVGDLPATVRDTAETLNANLLVIGRSHGSGILGRLRASAYSILREAPCPVVSI
jgi:nucleotide-binding universal stress UspA family protein